jgi:hypothetical protein
MYLFIHPFSSSYILVVPPRLPMSFHHEITHSPVTHPMNHLNPLHHNRACTELWNSPPLILSFLGPFFLPSPSHPSLQPPFNPSLRRFPRARTVLPVRFGSVCVVWGGRAAAKSRVEEKRLDEREVCLVDYNDVEYSIDDLIRFNSFEKWDCRGYVSRKEGRGCMIFDLT